MGGDRLIPSSYEHPFTKRDHLDEWIEKNKAHCRNGKTACEGVGDCKCSCEKCIRARLQELQLEAAKDKGTREFHTYECESCKCQETYPGAAHTIFDHGNGFRCGSCGGLLSLVSTRVATLTLHPKTGKFCIEEDLKLEDY